MPCSDGGPSPEEERLERDRQRGLAVGLCIACSALDSNDLLPPSLNEWYHAHQLADIARDAECRAQKDCDEQDAYARGNGFGGLSMTHPMREALNRAYSQRTAAERAERKASAALSRLKPE